MIRILLALGGVIFVLLAPSVAGASEDKPTLLDLEKKVMCPTCNATLELSHAPIADRIRVFIVERIDAGDTETQIKDKLVAQFGERILAAPRKSGFNLIVWVLPLVAIVAAGAIVFMILRRWFRSRGLTVDSAGEAAVTDPAIQRRIDDDLARLD
jgi:cytochrome c-type biogenesis protein CcmH